ncbi:MAG: cytochrome o ubiquinol oxidase subunit IV [Sphingomonas sp.]|uniref:cytochrome o ubiquinol oxidase subunit IV n=1 Tax=Sphingomonas sp. TaxID=28214 RepID=UPI001AD16688|nr:cytochrome o ubiquinol oxidase subunit IV [Sphingomonas sp.]MBN8809369.1 cytochrome o ubiquinol oxidase subunit IV [Sphingomonas sp.]
MSADIAEAHGSRRTYLVGFIASVVLTAIPFWLVMSHTIADPRLTAAIVVASAFVQILVHTLCFLHVNSRAEGGWTLMAYVFTAVLLLICISGSLWIMHHLNANMMPTPTTDMSNQP